MIGRDVASYVSARERDNGRGAPLAPLLRVWERISAQSVKSAVGFCSE